METLLQDLRYSLRMLTKSPGFTTVAVLTLALGIGANTAIFSVADAFLLKPLPLNDLNRLIVALERAPGQTEHTNYSVSPANFKDWKSQSTSFEYMSAFAYDNVNLTGNGDPVKVQGILVSASFFKTLGVEPLLGRAFSEGEEHPGREQEVILSHGIWERRFGSDPSILGKTVVIDGRSYLVIGVMKKGFEFPLTAELWLPLALSPSDWNVRNSHYLEIVGRLKSGISISEAQAEMMAIARRLSDAYPQTNKSWGVRVMSMRAYVTGDLTRHYTVLLLGAVACVLLIACSNVANVQFALATGRQKEIAVRLALGASRWRVIRQLLTESVLLAAMGAVTGLLFAEWGIEVILVYMPPDVAKFIAGWKEISLDHRAFLFTLAIAMIAGILSGLAPALNSSRPDLNETLKEGGRSATAGRAHHRIRNVLVVCEVALSLILLMGAGLTVKGFWALLSVNQNTDPASLLTMRVTLSESNYKETPQRVGFYDQVLRNLKNVAGIKSVAFASSVPFGNNFYTNDFSVESRPLQVPGGIQVAMMESVSPEYFQTMHVRLLHGREFRESDGAETTRVAIVSESLARHYFPGEDPLGKRIKLGTMDANNPWLTIVGVVQDIKYDWLSRNPRPTLYRPYSQSPFTHTYILARGEGNPLPLVASIRSQIAKVDPDLPLFNIKTLDRVIMESIIGLGYVAWMMAVLGIIALILSSVGVFSVMSYSVTERIHEIGIRMALGAQQSDVMKMVLTKGMLLTVLGIGIGLPVAVVLTRLLSSLLFGVSAMDTTIFEGVSLVLTFVALLASYLPAHRATMVDPMAALRDE